MLPILFSSIIYIILPVPHITHSEVGLSSMYHPGDGHCGSTTSCMKPFTWKSDHIAHRRWHILGCGRKVLACVVRTGRCVRTRIGDSGPWGITDGKRWKVWVRQQPPKGWWFRGHYDLSHALWARLGKPAFLSQVRLYFLP